MNQKVIDSCFHVILTLSLISICLEMRYPKSEISLFAISLTIAGLFAMVTAVTVSYLMETPLKPYKAKEPDFDPLIVGGVTFSPASFYDVSVYDPENDLEGLEEFYFSHTPEPAPDKMFIKCKNCGYHQLGRLSSVRNDGSLCLHAVCVKCGEEQYTDPVGKIPDE